MGKLLTFAPTDRTLQMRIARECSEWERRVLEDAEWLYQISAGWQDPLPPDDEQRKMMEEGVMEP